MIVAQERYEHYSLPEENRRITRRPRRNSLPRKGQIALTGLVCIIFCTGILIAFYYTQVLVTGYKIYRLEKELAVLQQETNQLNEQILRLTSLERVERIATTKLGMVRPDSKSVVLVKANLGGDSVRAVTDGVSPAAAESGGEQAESTQQVNRSRILQAFVNLVGHIRG